MSNRKAQKAGALIESALKKIQEGQSVQARLLCEQALALSPRDPDALHLLGVAALQGGEPAAAIEPLQKAVAIRPDHPGYQANMAYAYVGLKRYAEAHAAFQRAVNHAPNDPDLQLALGNCLGMLGRAADAEAAFRRLVDRHPRYPLGWFNLANTLKDQDRHQEALALYVRVTELAPALAEAHCNLGVVLHKLGRFEDSERAFRACLARKPDFVAAHVSLAIALNDLRRHEEAEALCRKALVLDPGQKNVWPILGRALVGQARWGDALQSFQRAAAENPRSSDALGDVGEMLMRAGRTREALDAFDRGLALGNASSFVHFFKATALLSMGRIADGAAAYMGRHERSAFARLHPDRSLAWELPEDLRDQDVCVLAEQGIGDELFFLRYAPLLKGRGCRLRLHVNPKIVSVIEHAGIADEVAPPTRSYPSEGILLLAGDLPHLLGPLESSPTSHAAAAPEGAESAAALARPYPSHCRIYWPHVAPPLPLRPAANEIASIRERLRRVGPPPYVGLTWRAGTPATEQRGNLWALFKEIALEDFAAPLRTIEATLISVQRKPQSGETQKLAALIGRPVDDWSAANDNLEEMVALLAELDEYVGVSNTNMHLRAGVGKTARVLVPWPAEWRWLSAGGSSPWFPGFGIYRQARGGDWSKALARLAHELGKKSP